MAPRPVCRWCPQHQGRACCVHWASLSCLYSSLNFLGYFREQNVRLRKARTLATQADWISRRDWISCWWVVVTWAYLTTLLSQHQLPSAHLPPLWSFIYILKHSLAKSSDFWGIKGIKVNAKLSANLDERGKLHKTVGWTKALARKGKPEHAIAYCLILDINMLGRKQCNTQELAHFLEFRGLGNPLDFFIGFLKSCLTSSFL